MLKVVIDTNVYLSGIFWTGNPREVLYLMKRGIIQVFISEDILREIRDVITRQDKPFKLSIEEAGIVTDSILKYAAMISPAEMIKAVKDDPHDNKIIECAVEAGASYIISGDPHLKDLKEYRHIKIVSPSEFCEIMGCK